ncbi:MAG: hypothetical protein NTX53_10540 [candidate division WOR-3 bacterium]|nr:hypothetical protein [candidate division WOR-3 bacterium]
MKRLALLLLLPALALAIYDMNWFDPNNWRAPFYNDGRWGIDVTVGSGIAGGTWPQGKHNCYVFGAGPWFAAILPSPSPETLCSFMYNPNSGGTEMCPTLCRYWREGYDNIRDRIYKYPGDWPPSHSRFPMAPLDPRSDMDLWCCSSDSDPALHISPGRPLGIDVFLTACGYSDSLAQDFFFLRYELANCSGDTLRQAIFGMMLDADIGDGTDDMAGLILNQLFHVGPDTIRVKNTGFVYDYNNLENPGQNWESGTPGAVAIMLLSAPESLGLTAFKMLTLDIDPLTDGAQYLTLAGFNYRTGEYAPYDSVDMTPADKRVLLATGPFDLAPDSTLTFWYAVICSPFGEQGQSPEGRDTSELALRCKWARDHFERLTGIAEESPSADVRTTIGGPTIVRGILFLPPSHFTLHSSLFSLSGQKVMSLRPGPNDVSRLTPGVYFVRGVQTRAPTIRKVVIAR